MINKTNAINVIFFSHTIYYWIGKKYIDQGNLIQGKAQQALKNLKNQLGDQREDSLTSLEVCYLL